MAHELFAARFDGAVLEVTLTIEPVAQGRHGGSLVKHFALSP
jgi:hypothetical protein